MEMCATQQQLHPPYPEHMTLSAYPEQERGWRLYRFHPAAERCIELRHLREVGKLILLALTTFLHQLKHSQQIQIAMFGSMPNARLKPRQSPSHQARPAEAEEQHSKMNG